jgi:non-ribosomal peptide synthetase component F
MQGFKGARLPLSITHEVSEKLKELSRREGVTLFMTMLAALDVLLRYYSKQDDLVVGTNVANRNRGETEGLIGFFVNMLLMRGDLSGNPGFVELLRRVREVCLGAYAHQDVPFEKVIEMLRPERDLSRQSLFQVKINVDADLIGALELKGLTLSLFELPDDIARYDMQLFVTDTKEKMVVSMVYNIELFDVPTATRMGRQFETLLQEIVLRPDARLNEFDEVLARADKKEQEMQEKNYKNSIQQRLRQMRQKAVVEAS